MKYIEADRLKAKLDEHYRKYQSKYMETRSPYTQGLIDALDLAEQVIESLQQEQPEVDLEEEIRRTYRDGSVGDTSDMDHNDYENIARHFYGFRNRALEEAARHVYESWMGGTMDDVRRDMVELGKVLNARKEE